MLKNRVQTLEKESMNAEIELRAANKALKEKSMDNNVRFRMEHFSVALSVNLGFINFAGEASNRSERRVQQASQRDVQFAERNGQTAELQHLKLGRIV